MAKKKSRRKPGRPKGSKNKKRKAGKRKASKKTSKKRGKKKSSKKRSKQVPSAVIVLRAKALKKNKRAAGIYRDVLGC
jgi:hypothetical protein